MSRISNSSQGPQLPLLIGSQQILGDVLADEPVRLPLQGYVAPVAAGSSARSSDLVQEPSASKLKSKQS